MAAPPPTPPAAAAIAALRLELRDGRMQLRAAAPLRVALNSATVALAIRRGGSRLAWEAETLRADGLGAVWEETGLRLELYSAEVDGALVLSFALENRGAEAVALEEIAPLLLRGDDALQIGDSAAGWSIFRNGYQSWSGTRAYRSGEADADPHWIVLRESHVDVRHRAAGKAGVLRSDLVGAVVDEAGGNAFAVGFLDTRSYIAGVEIAVPHGRFQRLAAVLDGDGIPLEPGQRLELPPLWLAAGADGAALLAAWATAAGRAMQARVAARAPSGWCSWYYYFAGVTEEDILANLEPLAALRERVPCDYVMIDDGYQRAIGDWLESNEKFPHGMRWLANRIRAAGFDAGIWMAPFLVRPEARLFAERPEWLVRTPSGRPLRGCWNPVWGKWRPAYALDTTHPEVLDWLRELARTAVQQWGYRILKLDFLYAAALPGVRYDAAATRAESLRRGLQAIRDGAGSDTFLLGCGCPLGPAVGVVDGMRIGPDVAPFWTNWLSRWLLRDRHGVSTANAVRNTLTRAFMHRRLWLNDPDCLMVRASETALTLEEVRTLAAAIGLTDGMFVVSDRMDTLDAERVAILEAANALRGGEAHVADLFAGPTPELVRSSYADRTAIGAFNFSERAAARTVSLGTPATGARELWSNEERPIQDGQIELDALPPHGCRVVIAPKPPLP